MDSPAPASYNEEEQIPAPVPVELPPVPSPAPGEVIYTCTMHLDVREEEPGLCPECGMTLVPIEGTDS